MLAILFPQINHIAFNIFSFNVYWYSFAYIFGFIFSYLLISRFNASTDAIMNKKEIDDLILFSVLGLVIGARLGNFIFYYPDKIISEPIQIFMIRKGGMSFHGGLLGLALSTFLFSKKYKIKFLKIADQISVVAPIGIFLGRIANFVNKELYGKVTDVPWGVIFPNGGNLPRHPSQLYEALTEGLLLFIILFFLYLKSSLRKKPGIILALFFILYGVARIITESFRELTTAMDHAFGIFTMGQVLSFGMIITGLYLVVRKLYIR